MSENFKLFLTFLKKLLREKHHQGHFAQFSKLLTFYIHDKKRITHCVHRYATLNKNLLVYQLSEHHFN